MALTRTVKVAIYGMGVLGRELFREIKNRFPGSGGEVQIMAVCDPNITLANLAYLIKYDSVYHGFDTVHNVKFDVGKSELSVDGVETSFYDHENIQDIPLAIAGVEYVFDCSGALNATTAAEFFRTGAKKVIALYPYGNSGLYDIVYGVSEDQVLTDMNMIDMATVEAQVGAIVLKILNDNYGVVQAACKSFTSYTNAQNTIDSLSSPNYEQGRAGAWNITPYYITNVAKQIGKSVVEVNGKVTDISYRAPVIVGGAIDITCTLAKIPDITSGGINAVVKSQTQGAMKDVLAYTEEPLVSSDVLGFDKFQFLAQATKDADGPLYSVSVLYDNIRGQALQAIRLLVSLCDENGAWG